MAGAGVSFARERACRRSNRGVNGKHLHRGIDERASARGDLE